MFFEYASCNELCMLIIISIIVIESILWIIVSSTKIITIYFFLIRHNCAIFVKVLVLDDHFFRFSFYYLFCFVSFFFSSA